MSSHLGSYVSQTKGRMTMKSTDGTVKVVVIRHGKKENVPGCGQGTTSWAIQSKLVEKGIAGAKTVAARMVAMFGDCKIFGCSPLVRAQETLFIIMEAFGIGVGEYADHIYFDHRFWSVAPSTWYNDVPPETYTNAKILALRLEGVEEDGHAVLDAAMDLAYLARHCGENVAIAVSHGGPLDAAIMLAKREQGEVSPITDIGAGEGIILSFDAHGDIVDVEDFLNVPEPVAAPAA